MKHFSGLPQAFNKEYFPPLFWLWIISGMKITEAEGGGGRSDPLSTTRHFQRPLVPFPFSCFLSPLAPFEDEGLPPSAIKGLGGSRSNLFLHLVTQEDPAV